MVFSSHIFLFYFLPVALTVYYLAARMGLWWRNLALAALGYLFYGWANPRYVALMFGTTFTDWVLSKIIACDSVRFWLHHDADRALPLGGMRSRLQRGMLMVSIVLNLGVLAVFKYLPLGMETVNGAAAAMGSAPIFHEIIFLKLF
jgi:alginate O-acetyltransferase complex protein AlgI